MKFSNLKISTRLAVLVGFLSLLLVGVGSLGLIGIRLSNDALKTVYEDRAVPLAQLGEIHRMNLLNRIHVANSLVFPEEIARNTSDIEANMVEISKIWDAYMATYLTPEESKLAKKFVDDRTQFVKEGLKPAIAALRAGDTAQAKQLVRDKLRPLYVPVGEDLEALTQLQVDVSKTEYELATARFERTNLLAIFSVGIGIVLAVLLGWVVVRGITRQLGAEPSDVQQITTAIAGGDLSTPIVVKPGMGHSVMGGMATMQIALRDVVSNVRMGAQNLSAASAEIAQGNNDLSVRTESQASALEETAASMEELSSTVQHNADNSRQGNQLAQNAANIAQQGGEAVSQVVHTMKGINESSKKIADIINVIDGIAFQTNILALNAAVEAARAGDQGRGFAVVATEVRSLAQRSAQAAKEIKGLINHSAEQVEQGTMQVDVAGKTMHEVVASIQRVASLMGEISAASAEQSAGVEQVAEAVTEMDQVTQQNAALVEESAAAASSLKSQAEQLVNAVAIFKIDAAGIPAHSQRAPTYAGVERRGPNRATNVARLAAFGNRNMPTADTSKHSETSVLPPESGVKTGTNGWTSL